MQSTKSSETHAPVGPSYDPNETGQAPADALRTAAPGGVGAAPGGVGAAPAGEGFTPTRTLAEQGALPDKAEPWTKIRLDLPHCQLTPAQLREIAEFIESQSASLRDLSLDLSGCSGLESLLGLEEVFRSLGSAAALEVLVIYMRSPAYTDNDETLAALGQSLTELDALGAFALDIAGHNFSDVGVATFFYQVSRVPNLRQMWLSFARGKRLSAQSFEHIEHLVAASETLKKLSLDFSHMQAIDDEASAYFGPIAGRIAKALEEFNVNISGTACTNDGLENILRGTRASPVERLSIHAFDVARIDHHARAIVNGFSSFRMKASLYTRPEDFT
ncbi:hypothetical protein [Pandoraea oxalativorans]|uniref:Uncharacterized protein n=1 Tax=Pandoraea oxalativorans TaxID=573737 RepID=A0A0G3IE58_9BURK|nr:hypothetical protein [Pandoraea oxalativorans]AKK24838.1 hypothetical protein MB84_29125 [Pandoraea oxalativorans]